MNKVFCLGFWRTGTKSIAEALNILGYSDHRECWPVLPGIHMLAIEFLHFPATWTPYLNEIYKISDKYNAFSDTPWHFAYPHLYKKYPDADFILVTRETDALVNSCVAFDKKYAGIDDMIHAKDYYKRRYLYHNNAILEYFNNEGKDANFISIDLKDLNWNTLCNFLKKPKPDIPFPHINRILT